MAAVRRMCLLYPVDEICRLQRRERLSNIVKGSLHLGNCAEHLSLQTKQPLHEPNELAFNTRQFRTSVARQFMLFTLQLHNVADFHPYS